MIKKIKEFIVNHYILLIVIIVPLGAILFLTGLISYNESSNFCYTCHIVKGHYVYFDKERPVHKNVDKSKFSCIGCHTDKAVQTIYKRDLKKIRINAELIGNLQAEPLINPKATYSTEECLKCHPDRKYLKEREPYLLQNDALRKIGLRFDKYLHHRFETFSAEDQQRYQDLIKRPSLTPEEQKELALLNKIRLGNCAQCHVRSKTKDGKKIIDKGVNYIARNPITCAGCHEDAWPLTHPGKPLKPPTKEVCQKCHHGKIHGKFLIFKADCDETTNSENCVKCHPYYKPGMDLTSAE